MVAILDSETTIKRSNKSLHPTANRARLQPVLHEGDVLDIRRLLGRRLSFTLANNNMINRETAYIRYLEDVPDNTVAAFLADCEKNGVPIESESHELEPQAGIEEYLPTVIVLYLAKPFIEAFLKKAGEDGYALFKGSMARLISRANKLRVTILSSGTKKISPDYSFCRAFSIYSVTPEGRSLKFLFPDSIGEDDCASAVTHLLEFIEHDKISQAHGIPKRGVILLSYSAGEWLIHNQEPKNLG